MNSLFSALATAAGGKSPPKQAAPASTDKNNATGTSSNPFGATVNTNLLNKLAHKFEDEIFQGDVLQEAIKKHQADIDETVQQLDDKLEEILEKHEKDFLTAYRYHMLKV